MQHKMQRKKRALNLIKSFREYINNTNFFVVKEIFAWKLVFHMQIVFQSVYQKNYRKSQFKTLKK